MVLIGFCSESTLRQPPSAAWRADIHHRGLRHHTSPIISFIQYTTTIKETRLYVRYTHPYSCAGTQALAHTRIRAWKPLSATSVRYDVYAVDSNHLLIWEIESGSLWARSVCVMTCMCWISITCSSEISGLSGFDNFKTTTITKQTLQVDSDRLELVLELNSMIRIINTFPKAFNSSAVAWMQRVSKGWGLFAIFCGTTFC